MSPIARSTQQQSSENTPKKKFGKNLNKLTKPPAPPTSSNPKSNASSRNGLLLLSTKRPSSGNNAASSSGGILSSKSSQFPAKPLPSLGLQYESSLSTHDALLGAVVGASRAEQQQQPDAWGVAEKQQKESMILDANVGPVDEKEEEVLPKSENFTFNDDLGPDGYDTAVSPLDDVPSSNWDEYGGRNISVNGGSLFVPEGALEDPKVTMSKLARERAEKRRAEEEARQNEQRQRASQKLRELEQKIASEYVSDEVASLPEVDPAVRENLKPKFILEKLCRSHSMPEDTKPMQPTTPSLDRNPNGRTLYDPERSYSSLVGGSSKGDFGWSEPLEVDSQPRNGRITGSVYSPDAQESSDSRDPYSRQPVIQLSSYEDRDRGERVANAGPRMLYDPKSGSMVAVPSREEAACTRGRKDRAKKVRTPREKETKGESKPDVETSKGKKGKRKEEKKEILAPAKVEVKKGKISNKRALPRTLGVLYEKDSKGNFACADGCDADLGYGAHSVPGGRTKNPDAYAKFVEGQKQLHQEDMEVYDSHHLENSFEADLTHQDGNTVTLHTGFSVPDTHDVIVDWVKPNEKIELITGIDESPTLQATAKEWAPSRAALAAAAAVSDRDIGAHAPSVGSLDADDDDDDDDGPFGLGFDPTLNMDSVMQSPSSDPRTGLDVNLAALSLEPALQAAAKTNHIFAFGAGSTWGSSNTSGHNDWGIPSAGSAFAPEDQDKPALAASFLSLSSSTWGGVPGFGGTSLGGTPLNGDHTRSGGD